MVARLAVIVIAGAVAIALVFTLAAPASSKAMRLVGTTGPGRTITLKKDGKELLYLKQGRYTITVRDRSSKHGFRISSHWQVGVNLRITTVRFVGTKTVTATLKPGIYYYWCPAHLSHGMRGPAFRVE
jgi:hypothetical protein